MRHAVMIDLVRNLHKLHPRVGAVSARISILLIAGLATVSAAGPVRVNKVDGPLRYGQNVVHGPLTGLDVHALAPLPANNWDSPVTLTGIAGPPDSITASHRARHRIAPHGGEAAPGPWWNAPDISPAVAAAGLITIAGASGTRDHGHTDYFNHMIAALWGVAGQIRGYAWASSGAHDPVSCAARKAVLLASEAYPPSHSQAFGAASFILDRGTNMFIISVSINGIARSDLTGAQLSAGGPGQQGPVIFDLGPLAQWDDYDTLGVGRIVDDTFPVASIPDLLAGRIYINVRTIAYPGGEVRGQLVAQPIYSNSGDINDPYKVTRTGGQCGLPDGDASDVQSGLGLIETGWSARAAANDSVADDFIVPAGQTWTLDGFKLYLFQPGATAGTITSIDYAILQSDPSFQPPPGWTNVAASSYLSKTFKKFDADPANIDCGRQFQEVFVPLSTAFVAAPGHYWLAWRANGANSLAGPSQAPVVIPGQPTKPGANGLYSYGGLPFTYAIDDGTGDVQDFVFALTGSILVAALGGDMNCDGRVDAADLPFFTQALIDPAGFTGCDINNADANQDGVTDGLDIQDFVRTLLMP